MDSIAGHSTFKTQDNLFTPKFLCPQAV